MRTLLLALALSGCVVGVGGAPAGDPGGGGSGSGDPGGGSGSGSGGGSGSGTGTVPTMGTVLAFPGGTSIAIRWTGVPGATSYQIERDGTMIGTQTPGYHADFPEKDGNGYIDRNVTAGTQYTYKVVAVGSTQTEVGTVTATLSISTTPPPAITIDTSQAPDLAGWMQNTVQPFLLTWYPKIGDALAQPDYVPPHALTLTLDPNYTGVAYTSGQHIVMSAAYARAHQDDLGAWLHESTHALQSYSNIPGWITEGMADYSREWILHDRDPVQPGPGNTYLTGYSEGSYFLAWIQGKYSPGLVHAVNIAAHGATYTDQFFVAKTGKTIDQLWTEMVGAPPAAPVTFTQMTNKCLQAGDASSNNVEIATCNAGLSQGFGAIHNSDGTISIAHNHDCVDVAGSSTTTGATIWIYACNGTGAQKWIQQADGSLMNPESGKCAGLAAATTDGSPVQLEPCDGSAAQRFSRL